MIQQSALSRDGERETQPGRASCIVHFCLLKKLFRLKRCQRPCRRPKKFRLIRNFSPSTIKERARPNSITRPQAARSIAAVPNISCLLGVFVFCFWFLCCVSVVFLVLW